MNIHNLRKTAVLASCCLTASWVLASPALAMTTPGALPVSAIPVSDNTLSHIVGRGVIGGKIVYFGVEMQTNWTSSSNQTPMSSTMNVALNSSGNLFTPTITYSTQGVPPAQQGVPANTSVSGCGLNNIQGVTQAIQIGGDANAVQNGMSLNVVQGTPNTSTAIGTSLGSGTHIVNGVTMTVDPGQLSMALSNGANNVEQGIGSNGVFQITQVRTNMNNIQNHMTLTLGVNPNAPTSQNLAQLQSLVNSVRNLQPAP